MSNWPTDAASWNLSNPGSLWLPQWSPALGDVPYHYRELPAGHRCLWTCLWAARGGVITPDNLAPAELLSSEACKVELEDYAARARLEPFYAAAPGALEEARELGWDSNARTRVLPALRRLRQLPADASYIFWASPPFNVRFPATRPGWDSLVGTGEEFTSARNREIKAAVERRAALEAQGGSARG